MSKIFLDFFFKLAAYVLPWAVRRFYYAEKIADHIKVRVCNEGDGITFSGGDLPTVRIWLRITNLSPIEIEFDRIFGHVFYGSQLAEFQDLQRRRIQPASEIEFLIEAHLTSEQVEFVRRNMSNKFETSLSLSAFLHSCLHNFQIPFRQVRTKNIDFINFHIPSAPVKSVTQVAS